MYMLSKKKLLITIIITNFLLLTISDATLFSGSIQSSDDIDLTDLIPSPTILYDSVELFPDGQSTLSLNISFQKNWIYYFSFESYVPFSDTFMMDAFCQTPAGRNYHFFDYADTIENDVTKIYFEYGSAESGHHLINIVVNTSQNINIHVYLEEYLALETYYDHYTLEGINESEFYCDINQYSSLRSNKIYSYPVKDDMEYKFNFFRVNPISQGDIEENNYENPDVEMLVSLNGTIYYYYREIPTLDYALYGNVENDGFLEMDRTFYNQTFIERFGAHTTGNLTILIWLEGLIPFDLNFAFMVWEAGDIGNGTDDVAPPENVTIPNPINNDTEPELYNKPLSTKLDEWLASTGLFIQSNWWTLFIVMGSVLALTAVFGKYKHVFKAQIKHIKKKIDSEISDRKNRKKAEEIK